MTPITGTPFRRSASGEWRESESHVRHDSSICSFGGCMKIISEQRARLLIIPGLALLSQLGCITPKPKIAPPTGIYNCHQIVTVTDQKPGSSIYYTTDGSSPTPSSTKYSGPFSINNTDKVQAIAQAPGSKVSTIATVMYTCAPGLTVAGFATQMQQRYGLPLPKSAIRFADLPPSDPNYSAAQAIAPFLNRQILCHGCMLSAKFNPNQPMLRASSAVFFVAYLIAQNKLQLLSPADSVAVLANTPDANGFSPLARRYLATAIKYHLLGLREGNRIKSAEPLSPTEMSTVMQTMQNQFNLPPANP